MADSEGPFAMVAGSSLNQPLHLRAYGVFVQNLTSQWVQVGESGFFPPNTSGSFGLGGTMVAVAKFLAPPKVAQPASIAGQTCFLTYVETPLPFVAGPTQGSALASVVTLERFARANIPASSAANAGRLIQLTDSDRSILVDDGTAFHSTTGEIIEAGAYNFATNANAVVDAIAALPANGGTVHIGPGEFATNEIILPALPKVVRLVGSGIGATVLRAAAQNQRILRVNGTVTGAIIGGFSVKAHALGSTGEAILMAGMRSCVVHDVDYQSNGAGNFTYFIRLSAIFGGVFVACYGNVIWHPVCQSQSGPSNTLIRFDNDGTALAANNANGNDIYSPWFYANNNVLVGVDARRSALTRISGGLMESNAQMTSGVIPGSGSTIDGVWFEALASVNAAITAQTGVDGAANNVTVRTCQLTGLTVTIVATLGGWQIYGNLGGTFVDNGGDSYILDQATWVLPVKGRRQIYPGSGVTAATSQTNSGLLAGTGVPTNAVGNDGDIYFRADGGAGTTIYQRRAGVWVATAA